MTFINNANDFTLTSSTAIPVQPFQYTTQKKTFDQAAEENRIYQGNGLVCQTAMCASLTGCESKLSGCSQHPDWSKILDFCGPNSTGSIANYGTYWVPFSQSQANTPSQLVKATEKALGLSALPNPYNTTGMY
jgi:hypothetical protein